MWKWLVSTWYVYEVSMCVNACSKIGNLIKINVILFLQTYLERMQNYPVILKSFLLKNKTTANFIPIINLQCTVKLQIQYIQITTHPKCLLTIAWTAHFLKKMLIIWTRSVHFLIQSMLAFSQRNIVFLHAAYWVSHLLLDFGSLFF